MTANIMCKQQQSNLPPNVITSEIRVNWGNINSWILSSFFLYLSNKSCSLRDIVWSTNLKENAQV